MAPVRAAAAPRMAMSAFGAAPGGYVEEPEVDMATAAAEVSEGITSTFIIPGKQTIKDGEKSHTVVIRDLVLEGKFANTCVPKSKEVAYLQVPRLTMFSLLTFRHALKIILITHYFPVK